MMDDDDEENQASLCAQLQTAAGPWITQGARRGRYRGDVPLELQAVFWCLASIPQQVPSEGPTSGGKGMDGLL